MLKQTIDEREIILIIYEIMNYIHSTFLYDFIIEGKIDLNDYGIVIMHKVKVMGYKEFIEPDFRTDKKYSINNSYVKYPHFQIEIDNTPTFRVNTIKKELSLISKSNKESTITIVSNSKYYYNPENNKTFVLDSFEKKYLEPIGVNNKSIYCYMISCFQVLLSIPEMNYYFLYKKYKKSEQRTLICDDYSEFISLYEYFQKNNKNQIDIPPSIYNICHSFLQKDVMNDCEEFFILFLKSMQEELNMKINGNKINNNNENKNDIEKMWNDYRKENDSFIDGLFTGLIRSTVICNKCQNEFYNYEPFMDLAVPIPNKNKSILNCLNIYFDCEYIDCNYHCEKCKFETNVSMIKYNLS
jgi:ubiquitin C-terminal hydrolase